MKDSIHFASRCSACTPRQSSTSCAVDPSRRRCSRSIDCSWSLKSYHCDRIVRIMRLSVTFWSVLLALLFCIWGAWFALQLVLLLLLATGASGCLSAHLICGGASLSGERVASAWCSYHVGALDVRVRARAAQCRATTGCCPCHRHIVRYERGLTRSTHSSLLTQSIYHVGFGRLFALDLAKQGFLVRGMRSSPLQQPTLPHSTSERRCSLAFAVFKMPTSSSASSVTSSAQ